MTATPPGMDAGLMRAPAQQARPLPRGFGHRRQMRLNVGAFTPIEVTDAVVMAVGRAVLFAADEAVLVSEWTAAAGSAEAYPWYDWPRLPLELVPYPS